MTGGAASIIHSIYGRQLSNLVFATPDGDAGGECRASSSPATKLLVRPKSSPAGRKAVRPRSAALPLTTVRTRPGSAAARSTTAPRGRGGGGKVRPKTAAGTRLQEEQYVHDLEERDDVETRAQLKGPSTPVYLTRVPEYFNFWAGKPLQPKEFGVAIQTRKKWERPKSDYGTRFFSKRNAIRPPDTLAEIDGGANATDGKSNEGRNGMEGMNNSDVDGETGRGLYDGGMGGRGIDGGGMDGGGLDGGGTDGGGLDGGGLDGGGTDGGGTDGGGMDGGCVDGGGIDGGGIDGGIMNMKGGGTSMDGGNIERVDLGICDGNSTYNIIEHDKWLSDENGSRDKVNKITESGKWMHKQDGKDITEDDDYFKKAMSGSSNWLLNDQHMCSQRSTRFELPLDIKQLEAMNPIQYLSKHCIVSSSKKRLYAKTFTKLDSNKDSYLSRDEVLVALIDAHHHCITTDQAESVLEVAQLSQDATVSLQLFSGLASLTERMFSLTFLPPTHRHHREVVETADFEALEWKLRGCNISPALRTLFAQF